MESCQAKEPRGRPRNVVIAQPRRPKGSGWSGQSSARLDASPASSATARSPCGPVHARLTSTTAKSLASHPTRSSASEPQVQESPSERASSWGVPRLTMRRSSTVHSARGVLHRREPRRARGRAHLPSAAGGSEYLLRRQVQRSRTLEASPA